MALTPKDNEAFYREVDEELRRDQLRTAMDRYGKWLIGGIVLFLAAVGAYLWWQNHQRTQSEARAEELSAVLDEIEQGGAARAGPRLDKIIADGGASYRAQVMLTKAGIAIQAGKPSEAIDLYRKVAADGDVPQIYRDAALVRQTALEFDTIKPDAVIARLKPLAVQGNAWFGSAGEMLGLAYIRQGKPQLAGPIFLAIAKDEKQPSSLRERATQVATSLGLDTLSPIGAAKGAATKEASR